MDNASFPRSSGGDDVALSLQNRRIGDVIVVACAGRIVAGDEASQLEKHLFALLPDNPFLILNLHDIHYVDSGGVGLLVRLLNRARTARGDLKLCDVSERVREVLKITRLDRVFAVHASEPEAIAGFLHQAPATADSNRLEFDILYVESVARRPGLLRRGPQAGGILRDGVRQPPGCPDAPERLATEARGDGRGARDRAEVRGPQTNSTLSPTKHR